jgi:hypothetical protein
MANPSKNGTEKPAPKRFCGVKGKSGPPRKNRNAIRHGLRAGQLPKGTRYIEVRLNNFRRRLEDAVIAARGEVTIPDAGCIQSALRWERHAALAQRWLVLKYDELKPTDLLQFSREIARASTERDKALAALHLDRDDTRDAAIDALYRLPAPKETANESR